MRPLSISQLEESWDYSKVTFFSLIAKYLEV